MEKKMRLLIRERKKPGEWHTVKSLPVEHKKDEVLKEYIYYTHCHLCHRQIAHFDVEKLSRSYSIHCMLAHKNKIIEASLI
ncbi:MAG: hypothetical protein QXZ17_05590 [Nitrososphaerota archaeon]